MSEAGFVGRIGMGARSVTSQQFSLWRHPETLWANFVGHFVEKSNIFQNSSTKALDKVGDEDTRSAIMRTAGRAPQGVAHEYFRARPAPAPHPVGSTRLLCRDRPR